MRALYISGAVIFLLLVIGVPVYFKYFNPAPSCMDNKQNQDELGVDCGGVCAKLCPFEAKDPLISFERLYEASYGNYTALALVENPNQGVFARQMHYIFKIYDSDNVLLYEIPGTTFVPPGRIFPIFVSSILTGNRIASKVTFSIAGGSLIDWQKGPWQDPDVKISNIINKVVNSKSRIEADVMNNEVYDIKDTSVAVVVYDENGNAREASATIVDNVPAKSSSHIIFTWGKEFDFKTSKIDILPRLTPRDFLGE